MYIFVSYDEKIVVVPVNCMDKIYDSGHLPECLLPLYEYPNELLSMIETPFSYHSLLYMSSIYNNIRTSMNNVILPSNEIILMDSIFNLRCVFDYNTNKTENQCNDDEYQNMVNKFLSFRTLDSSVIISRNMKH